MRSINGEVTCMTTYQDRLMIATSAGYLYEGYLDENKQWVFREIVQLEIVQLV